MWVQEVRTLHRGTPNRSPGPRPELCLCYCRDWYAISQNVEMPQASYDALSARGKRLLLRCPQPGPPLSPPSGATLSA